MKELNSVEICIRLSNVLMGNGKTMEVHSVFAGVVNIIGEDGLFSLLDHRRCLFPMSCRVTNEIPFTAFGIRVGMEVIASGDRIIIPDVYISINLKDSRKRDLSFEKNEGLLVPGDLFFKALILKELIMDKGCEYDLSTLVTGKYRNPYADLVKKKLPGFNKAIRICNLKAREYAGEQTREQEREQERGQAEERVRKQAEEQIREYVAEQAAGLAGCGIGLTPSSDDMLIGYMSVYLADSKAKGCSSEDIYKVTNAIGNHASKHTNTISGAFLKQCGMGLLSEGMTQLMCALYSDSNAEIVRKCGQRIQNFGSTSGTDMLTGVVLAIINLNNGDCEYLF